MATSKSSGRRKKDASITDENEWENHWLMRVPESFADRVRNFCQSHSSKDRLRIKFDQDQRHGTLKIGADTLHFTAYDLPCIIELMKTIDNVNVFKVNNVSQMLLCTTEEPPKPSEIELSLKKPSTSTEETEIESHAAKQRLEKMYQYPHGILPPLKNVRKRRFRKAKKKKHMDAPEVDKEVKRLFRDDLSATKTSYKIVHVVDEGPSAAQKVSKEPKPSQPAQQTQDETNDLFEQAQQDLFAETQPELEDSTEILEADNQPRHRSDLMDVFGELSVSSSEEED